MLTSITYHPYVDRAQLLSAFFDHSWPLHTNSFPECARVLSAWCFLPKSLLKAALKNVFIQCFRNEVPSEMHFV